MNFKEYNELFNRENYPIFQNGLPTDNRPCPCLSGNQFELCCKSPSIKNHGTERLKEHYTPNNPMDIFSSKIEQSAIEKGMGKKYRKAKGTKSISFCSAYKYGNCDCKPPRYSHTLSVGTVFKNLTDILEPRKNGIVYGFNDHKMENQVTTDNIENYYVDYSCNIASRTCAFCETHDKSLFSEIEDSNIPYDPSNQLHNLEYALKATTYDLFESIEVIKYFSEIFKKSPEVARPDPYYDFFTHYEERVNLLFEYYEFQQKLIDDINSIKNENEPQNKLYWLQFKLPSNRVNFSFSETATLYVDSKAVLCSINVVNHKEPYLIIASYTDITSFSNTIYGITAKKPNNSCDYLFYVWLLSNKRNIYFNQNVFNALSNKDKYWLYLIHRLPLGQIIDAMDYMMMKKMIDKLLEL